MQIVSTIELVSVGHIKPYHRNVRHNDRTVELLCDTIPKVGFNVPLVLDRQNIIVKGHARFAAAVRLGLERVPCVYTDADDETNKLDRIADNKIQEFSKWDDDLLTTELSSINLSFDYDLAALGFKLNVKQIEAVAATPISNDDLADRIAALPAIEAPEDAYITPDDVLKTAPIKEDEYYKCTCNQCGNVMLIRR